MLFCGGVAVILWLCLRALGRQLSLVAMLLACLSHLVLDALVGVHTLPMLWPLADPHVTVPFGVLPSAGHLAFGNDYLWRNLLIESGVLWPVFGFFVAIARQLKFRDLACKALWVAPIWLMFLIWSVGLKRH